MKIFYSLDEAQTGLSWASLSLFLMAKREGLKWDQGFPLSRDEYASSLLSA